MKFSNTGKKLARLEELYRVLEYKAKTPLDLMGFAFRD